MKIFLNPGHDRKLDSGAVNPITGLREADVVYDVTCAITNCINDILLSKGINTKCLQIDSLPAICQEANSWGADYFVSVHCNAYDTVARGTEVEVFSYGTEASELANSVQSSIVKKLGTLDRGLRERPGLYVLKHTDMPAILIELAFIDNTSDSKLLTEKIQDFASAVASGILEFLDMNLPEQYNENIYAPNGKSYEKNDIDYLISQGYTFGDAISFLALSDKYSNSNIQAAINWANNRVGTVGYGNNGCTAFVRDFLISAGHWFGQLMKDGSQGNLMWVPNIMDYAKANNMWKSASEGGAPGDICLLETDGRWDDGPDHVVIACGDGNYWGNSSSRNKIVKSSIGRDYGTENVWGYVTTGSGSSQVASGTLSRSMDEIVGDAGTTSGVVHKLSPNGKVYEANDINYLLDNGYTYESAIEELSKTVKYSKKDKVAPNGKVYELNDIQYLINSGYTYDSAIALLSTCDKYAI